MAGLSWSGLAGALALTLALGGPPAAAQTAPTAVSDAQEVNGSSGVAAELIQCKRENGVLSVRLRVRNGGDQDVRVALIHNRNYDQYYVTAGSKKYFVLRDSEKTPLASPSDNTGSVEPKIAKGGSYVWYAKYPAPPAEVKKISFYTPLTPPFEDVPISD